MKRIFSVLAVLLGAVSAAPADLRRRQDPTTIIATTPPPTFEVVGLPNAPLWNYNPNAPGMTMSGSVVIFATASGAIGAVSPVGNNLVGQPTIENTEIPKLEELLGPTDDLALGPLVSPTTTDPPAEILPTSSGVSSTSGAPQETSPAVSPTVSPTVSPVAPIAPVPNPDAPQPEDLPLPSPADIIIPSESAQIEVSPTPDPSPVNSPINEQPSPVEVPQSPSVVEPPPENSPYVTPPSVQPPQNYRPGRKLKCRYRKKTSEVIDFQDVKTPTPEPTTSCDEVFGEQELPTPYPTPECEEVQNEQEIKTPEPTTECEDIQEFKTPEPTTSCEEIFDQQETPVFREPMQTPVPDFGRNVDGIIVGPPEGNIVVGDNEIFIPVEKDMKNKKNMDKEKKKGKNEKNKGKGKNEKFDKNEKKNNGKGKKENLDRNEKNYNVKKKEDHH